MYKVYTKLHHKKQAKQSLDKRDIVEELLVQREQLDKKHLEEILHEECRIGTHILQLKGQYSWSKDQATINALESRRSRLGEQRRRLETSILENKMQFASIKQGTTRRLQQWK